MTTPLRFGHFCLPTYYRERDIEPGAYMRRMVDFFASSEEMGFHSIWVNEHHFHPFGGMIPAAPVMLAALAQRTEHVRLGISVIVMPLHDPLEVAEQLTMVDLMSDGRLDIGVGSGFVLYDYEVLGVPFDEARERAREGLEVVTKAFAGGPFTHEGTFYRYPQVEVWPPAQQRRPPIWVACATSPASFAWTGEHGHKLLTVAFIRPIDHLAEWIGEYVDAWDAAGHDPAGRAISTHLQVVIDEDGAAARATAHEAMHEYLRLNFEAQSLASVQSPAQAGLRSGMVDLDVDHLIEQGRLLVGTPDEVAERLEWMAQRLRLTMLECTFLFGGMPFEKAQRSMRLFADEVMPRFAPTVTSAGAATG